MMRRTKKWRLPRGRAGGRPDGGVKASDITIGRRPTFNRDLAWISTLTDEQRLLDDRLAIEVERTHLNRDSALPPYRSVASRFQDILQIDASLPAPLHGVCRASAAYPITSQDDVQAGAVRPKPRAQHTAPADSREQAP